MNIVIGKMQYSYRKAKHKLFNDYLVKKGQSYNGYEFINHNFGKREKCRLAINLVLLYSVV